MSNEADGTARPGRNGVGVVRRSRGDRLAVRTPAAASDAGASLSDWVRQAFRHQLALGTARQGRSEEDRRAPLYDEVQEDAIVDARVRESAAAFDRDR